MFQIFSQLSDGKVASTTDIPLTCTDKMVSSEKYKQPLAFTQSLFLKCIVLKVQNASQVIIPFLSKVAVLLTVQIEALWRVNGEQALITMPRLPESGLS